MREEADATIVHVLVDVHIIPLINSFVFQFDAPFTVEVVFVHVVIFKACFGSIDHIQRVLLCEVTLHEPLKGKFRKPLRLLLLE